MTWFQDPTDHPALKDCPLGRKHYPKQMKFFGLEKTYDEIALFGGNRCITPWTVVSTDRGERQASEVIVAEACGVRSWGDDSLCTRKSSDGFLKCIESAFRVHLDNGEVFEATRKHRVLTPVGWLSLDQLASHANVRHWSRIDSGWSASYAGDGRQRDLRPLCGLDTGRELLPKPDDAPRQRRYDSLPDAAASRFERSRVYRIFDRPANLDGPARLGGLNGTSQWECPSLPPSALPKFPAAEVGGRSLEYRTRCVEAWQFAVLQTLLPTGSSDVWLPYNPIRLIGGNSILAFEAIGAQPIVDFTVEGTHSYVAAGAVHHNTGKTHCGCFADVLHLTGLYPDWWPGRRFTHPIDMWVATDTAKNTRDILQEKFCGKPGQEQAYGTGMIPGDLLVRRTVKHGLADAFESVFVRHVSGGISTLQFKSYDQGREAFQGTRQHRIHLDEEPKLEIYTECLLRLLSTVPGESNGTLVLTETPMLGVSDLMITFLPDLSPEPDSVPASVWETGEEEVVVDE